MREQTLNVRKSGRVVHTRRALLIRCDARLFCWRGEEKDLFAHVLEYSLRVILRGVGIRGFCCASWSALIEFIMQHLLAYYIFTVIAIFFSCLLAVLLHKSTNVLALKIALITLLVGCRCPRGLCPCKRKQQQ